MLTFSIFPNFPWIALLLSNAAFTLVMLGLSSAVHTTFQYLSTVIQAEGAEMLIEDIIAPSSGPSSPWSSW